MLRADCPRRTRIEPAPGGREAFDEHANLMLKKMG
jgi:hypothetical protein